MLKGIFIALTTSYIAWFFQHNETQALYPFDSAYSAPSDARLREERLTTRDGAELILWRADPAPGQPMVLYLPGNAGTLADRAPRFSDFLDRGLGLAALAYRGSSGSSGRPSESALTADGLRVAADLTGSGHALILYGESLGAALAVKLAAAGHGSAVVLEAPFTTLPDLVAAQYPNENLRNVIRQTWNTQAHIRFVEAPLLIVHGQGDALVPQDMGRAVFDAAPSPAKRFFDAGPRGHADLWTDDTRAAVFDFIAER